MTNIKSIHAREILDSRGNPTVEVDLVTTNDVFARAAVPSGASTGAHEALEMRDGGTRYGGKGVLNAVKNVNEVIAPAVAGMSVLEQEVLDEKMLALDGTPNKSKLGANAILGVSLAAAQAAAKEKGMALWEHFAEISGTEEVSLPVPCMNVINGGAHADNNLDIQEFMLVPLDFPTFAEALRAGAEIFHVLKKELASRSLTTTVGDEGGFAPNLQTHEEALALLVGAIDKAGYNGRVKLALDVAATEMFKEGKYVIEGESLTADQLLEFYERLVSKFPIVSIEDGFAEDDFEGWGKFVAKMGDKIQIVGDDLLVTNPERIKMAIEQKLANAALIKVNQIGSLTETIRAVKMAQAAGWKCMMSHRSGETEDTTIADLAVGLATGQIKSGSASRTERLAKYNQLMRIEETLADKFAGESGFGC